MPYTNAGLPPHVSPVAGKLGRKPNEGRPRVRLTADIAPTAAFTPPPFVDWYSKVPASTWGVDGNDLVGDCTCAEVDHAVKTLQVAAGNTEVQSTKAEVLAAYSAITGYDPSKTDAQGNNPTDQGAVMQDVRDYWRKHGFPLGRTSHTILMFAEVDHRNHDLIKWAISRFGELGVGIDFPASAMTQFNNGQPWDVVKHTTIKGGHAVAAVGYDSKYVYVVTWGRVQPMTWAFWDAYVEEAWTQLSTEFVNAVSGQDPLGETLYALGGQYAALTGQANPIPAPQPTPQPTPVPAPPEPGPDAFPAAQYEAFRAALLALVPHPDSKPKVRGAIATGQALTSAMDAYLGRLD